MMIRSRHSRTFTIATARLFLAGMVGCGASPPAPADAELARQALDRALTAWQEGKPADALKSERPPVVVADHQWSGGYRLEKFQVEPFDQAAGADRNFRVTLWLKGSKGKSVQEATEYNVGTSPALTVVRAGF